MLMRGDTFSRLTPLCGDRSHGACLNSREDTDTPKLADFQRPHWLNCGALMILIIGPAHVVQLFYRKFCRTAGVCRIEFVLDR